jgi:hypothetical protein
MRVCCEPCQEGEEGEEDVFDEGVEGREEGCEVGGLIVVGCRMMGT